ncbi:hypothetical protein TNCV_5089111 [Trichonephila clavipes]|nr:hypothetical protein TNCV_5089111 [Trichonephila clavipes]
MFNRASSSNFTAPNKNGIAAPLSTRGHSLRSLMELNTVSRREVKADSRYPHCAKGGAHRFQLLSSRGKGRLPLAWYSRISSTSDQSALPHRVSEGV